MTTRSLTDMLRLYQEHADDIEIIEPDENDLDSPERIRKQRAEGVKRGQLWMAKDNDGNSSYVLVTALCDDPRMATIVPLSNGKRMETADSLVIEKGAPLETPMVAWPAFRTAIPISLLFKPLKEFSPATVDSIEDNDPAKADPNDVVRYGTDPDDEMSEAFDERDDAALLMIVWHARCADLPELGQLDRAADSASDDLEAYGRALQDVLGLKPQIRLAVMRGQLALNASQRRKMAQAGFPEAPRKQEAIPDDYLILAEQPEFYEIAERINPANPQQARLDMARKAAYGLAARTTGHGTAALRGAFLKAAEQLAEDKGATR
ncbi:hypothetical protein JS532_02940 [Bifidobacterium callimiconis]|uniref:hypothetical protein n=1 Tax=Bifidobacterium callimiconis TaxID=2306973 RepID=UPI001BDDBF89|nr:hypothetical protein [Bifidobacterium callimiconis]MBT1176521.1 hypothetical protein [Bifidobacterium callimiconis]